MERLITIAIAALLTFGAYVLVRRLLTRVVVYEWEKGLRYVNGRFDAQVGPGGYWVFRPSTEIRKVDTRPAFVTIPGQEVLSSDGVTLRVSLAARYEVRDPLAATAKAQNYTEALYLTLQLGLREIIGNTRIDDLLARRQEIGATLTEMARPAIEEMGVRLLAVNIKDVMFPGNLQKIFAQVVQAQKEGQAALEKARGETAALRNLANAARLVEGNPALLQLRLLQQLSGSTGNSLIFGVSPATVPVPVVSTGVSNPPDAGPSAQPDAQV